jgi:PAS domain S-box-containing protein
VIENQYLNPIFKSAPLPILLLLPDAPYFTVADVNTAYLKATNTKEDSLVGKSVFETFPDNSEDFIADVICTFRQSLLTVISTGKPHTMALQTHDTSIRDEAELAIRYWEYQNIPVLDNGGNVVIIIHSALDVTEKTLQQKNQQQLTERNETAAQLKNSEYQYRSLFEQNLAGLYQSTLDGVIVKCNDTFVKMLKYDSQKELFEINASELYFSSASRNDFIRNVKDQKKLYNYEGALKCKDGSPLYFLENISLGNDAVTGEEFLYGILIDISKRKKAEDELVNTSEELKQALTEQVLSRKKIEESEKQYRQIVETAQEGIWMIDVNNKTIFVNKKMCEILGYTEEEMIGRTNFSFKDPEEQKIALQQIERRKKGLKETHESKFITKSGRHIWTQVSTNPILDEDGTYRGALAMFTDITEKKQAELSVIKAFEEKNIILESIGDAFFAVDKNWTVTYWNNQAEKMLKVPHHEIVGHHLWGVFSDTIGSESYKKYHQAIETNEVVHFEDYYPAFSKWYEISAYPSDNGLSVYFKDVTDRKLSEILLNELNENLQKHTKELAISNAELEQFAYVASHDLQEPLRMVTGFLTQLEKKYGDIIDEKGKKYIGFAVDGAKRMRQIILDLLEFSRVGRTEDNREILDLNELVKEILPLFQKQIEDKSAVFQVDELPVINAYKTPLRQVFQNLISNALKYTRQDIPCQIHITAKALENHWQFAVTDNGIGIAEEYFDKIFVIFQRLHNKDEFSGTGMGLAVTKKIIENLGGKIWVASEEGKGTIFYFTLLKQH